MNLSDKANIPVFNKVDVFLSVFCDCSNLLAVLISLEVVLDNDLLKSPEIPYCCSCDSALKIPILAL